MAHNKSQGPGGAVQPSYQQRLRATNWTHMRPNARARMRRVNPELAAIYDADADLVMAWLAERDLAQIKSAIPSPPPPAPAPRPREPFTRRHAVLVWLILGVALTPFTDGWSLLPGIILAGLSALPGDLAKKFVQSRSPRP